MDTIIKRKLDQIGHIIRKKGTPTIVPEAQQKEKDKRNEEIKVYNNVKK